MLLSASSLNYPKFVELTHFFNILGAFRIPQDNGQQDGSQTNTLEIGLNNDYLHTQQNGPGTKSLILNLSNVHSTFKLFNDVKISLENGHTDVWTQTSSKLAKELKFIDFLCLHSGRDKRLEHKLWQDTLTATPHPTRTHSLSPLTLALCPLPLTLTLSLLSLSAISLSVTISLSPLCVSLDLSQSTTPF